MKKNYLKSVGFVFLGVVLSTIFSSFLSRPSTEDFRTQSFEVPISTASKDIAAYQKWLKYLPDSISIETLADNTVLVNYWAKEIDQTDWKILRGYMDAFIDQNKDKGYSYSNLPFSSNLATSYYIPRAQIEKVLDHDSSNVTGMNVYVGLRGLDNLKLDTMETHLYVVPTTIDTTSSGRAHGELRDQFFGSGDEMYALDLTHPCPALCAFGSVLYHPQLNDYSPPRN